MVTYPFGTYNQRGHMPRQLTTKTKDFKLFYAERGGRCSVNA